MIRSRARCFWAYHIISPFSLVSRQAHAPRHKSIKSYHFVSSKVYFVVFAEFSKMSSFRYTSKLQSKMLNVIIKLQLYLLIKEEVRKVTKEQVKKELTDIKYYSMMVKEYEGTNYFITPSKQINYLLDKYDAIMEEADYKLYVIYQGLYIDVLKQVALASFLKVSIDTIKRRHTKLIEYLAEELTKRENA